MHKFAEIRPTYCFFGKQLSRQTDSPTVLQCMGNCIVRTEFDVKLSARQESFKSSAALRCFVRNAGRTKWSWWKKRSMDDATSENVSNQKKLQSLLTIHRSLAAQQTSLVWWTRNVLARNDVKFIFQTPIWNRQSLVLRVSKCFLKSAILVSKVSRLCCSHY